MFTTPVYFMDVRDRAWLSYQKAKAIGLSYGMSFSEHAQITGT